MKIKTMVFSAPREVVKIIDSMMETLQEEQKSEEKKKQNCREQYRSLALKERQLSSQRDDAEIQISAAVKWMYHSFEKMFLCFSLRWLFELVFAL